MARHSSRDGDRQGEHRRCRYLSAGALHRTLINTGCAGLSGKRRLETWLATAELLAMVLALTAGTLEQISTRRSKGTGALFNSFPPTWALTRRATAETTGSPSIAPLSRFPQQAARRSVGSCSAGGAESAKTWRAAAGCPPARRGLPGDPRGEQSEDRDLSR
jgi:hypothetical protein